LGIRYDKYVHFVNALAAYILITWLFRFRNIPSQGFNVVLIILTVMGLGAFVEIIEYIVTLNIAAHGVGGYDNNMQDLIGNLCGASARALLCRILRTGFH